MKRFFSPKNVHSYRPSLFKSQLSNPTLNLRRILKDNKEIGKNIHIGLYGSLPGFAVILSQTRVPIETHIV